MGWGTLTVPSCEGEWVVNVVGNVLCVVIALSAPVFPSFLRRVGMGASSFASLTIPSIPTMQQNRVR